MLIFTHIMACIWYYIGYQASNLGYDSWLDSADINNDNILKFHKYSYAIYWAVVTFFTTG